MDGRGRNQCDAEGLSLHDFFVPLASPLNASLLFATAFVLGHFVIAWVMWRMKRFVKI